MPGAWWYESKPYLCAIAGFVVLLSFPGTGAKVFGGLLLIAAGLILRLRWTYRNRREAARTKAVRRRGAPLAHGDRAQPSSHKPVSRTQRASDPRRPSR
jgi:hypothetical protein